MLCLVIDVMIVGEPKLECLVYNTDKLETIQRSVMVTSPGASIQWIGFSETSVSQKLLLLEL
jgi:hypothetical protein